jgi:hypothetical protein
MAWPHPQEQRHAQARSRRRSAELFLKHDPEKACPGLGPGGNRFLEKIMLKLV